jgi:tetratricopeptide (TPR) repeat protein
MVSGECGGSVSGTAVAAPERSTHAPADRDGHRKGADPGAPNLVDRVLGSGHGRSVAVVVLFGMVVFANSLRNGFAFDDQAVILNNPLVLRLRTPLQIFLSGYWPEPYLNVLYRPLVIASFAANYVVGGFAAWGYHLVNILLHAANGALAYALAWTLFHDRRVAFFAAAAFALHPIHTEAVANIVGRAELLAAFFVFLAWMAYLRAEDAVGRRRIALLASSILCFWLALLSKEHAAVFLGVLVMSDLFRGMQRRRAVSLREAIGLLGRPLRAAYPWYALTFGLYLAARVYALGNWWAPLAKTTFVDNPLIAPGIGVRLFTAIKVLGKYLWLLLVPYHLSADYSYNAIPLSRTLLDPGVLATLLSLGLLAAGAWLSRRRQPIFAFALSFFALTILPVSNLIVPIGTIMGERLLYLPSLAFCLVLGALADGALRWAGGRSGAMAALCMALVGVLLAAYGVRTFRRNGVWRNDRTLFVATLQDSPNSAKVRNYIGRIYADEGKLDEARSQIETAIKIFPGFPFAYYELGHVMRLQGRTDEALRAYQRAVRVGPDYGDAYYQIGKIYEQMEKPVEATEAYRRAARAVVIEPASAVGIALALFQRGSLDEAEAQLEVAIRRNPRSAEAHNNLGLVYLRQDRLEKARLHLQAAAGFKPDSPEVWANLGKVLARQGDTARARIAYQRALSLRPGYLDAASGMGALLAQSGNLDEAREAMQGVLKAEPKNAQALNNLGAVYEQQGRLKDAERAFQGALRLDPNYAEAHHNLGIVYGKQGRLAEARRAFESAIRHKPRYAKAHYGLGVVLGKLGKRDEARRELQIARQQGFQPPSEPRPRPKL